MTDEKVEHPNPGNGLSNNVLDRPPMLKSLWEIRQFVDPELGVRVEMAISADPLVSPIFRSAVHVMTNRGPADVSFNLDGVTTIEEAIKTWHLHAHKAVEQLKEDMKAQERRIVLPGAREAPFLKKPNNFGVN